jgi:hypothetical protein
LKIDLRLIFGAWVLLLLLQGCEGNAYRDDKNSACRNRVHLNIDSAAACAAKAGKLLLFAFVNADSTQRQNGSWEILKDPDIINTAKKGYVLLVLNPKVLSAENCTQELLQKARGHGSDTFFVVTNVALFPFREFSYQTPKKEIINNLELGDWP